MDVGTCLRVSPFCLILLSFAFFDFSNRRLFSNHNDTWVALGKPSGFLFQPNIERAFSIFGSQSRNFVFIKLLLWPLGEKMREDRLLFIYVYAFRLITYFFLIYIPVFILMIASLKT